MGGSFYPPTPSTHLPPSFKFCPSVPRSVQPSLAFIMYIPLSHPPSFFRADIQICRTVDGLYQNPSDVVLGLFRYPNHENRTIWSYRFVFDVANAVGQPNATGYKRRLWKKSTVVYNKKEGQSLSADVTRDFITLENCTMDNIQFTVQNPGAGGNT